MRYVYVARDTGFGAFGAWYDALPSDVLTRAAAWARSVDPSLTGGDADILARIAQPVELGGGFLAGGVRMCPSNRVGGPTEPMRSASQPCPDGSGGMGGSQVQEISADELRMQLEEQRRREAEERAGGTTRMVEVYGVVRDGRGNPVAGAMVTAGGKASLTSSVGSFSLDLLPGTYRFLVQAAGFQDRVLELVSVPIGTPKNVGAITLIGTSTVLPSDLGPEGPVSPKTEDTTGPWYTSTGFLLVGAVAVGGIAYLIWQRSRKGS